MQETTEQKQLPLEPQPLSKTTFVLEVFQGIGVMLGLGLLWMLESVRNVVFRLLDRWNFKPRPPRKASAFPPGSPRRRNVA